jgi:hypothetical protein
MPLWWNNLIEFHVWAVWSSTLAVLARYCIAGVIALLGSWDRSCGKTIFTIAQSHYLLWRHKMIVSIFDSCKIGTLLHLLCHCTSYVFGLIPWWNNFGSGRLIATDNCNDIPSVVIPTSLIEWWELASSIVTAMLPFGDIPTHELYDPRQLKCWHATSSTVSCIFYCRWIAAVVKQFRRWLARCKWQLHCFFICDCLTRYR